MAEHAGELHAEIRKLRKVRDLCVELVKLFEAVAAQDDDDEDTDDAMGALWDREQDICRRVMTLLPEEFPGGHLRKGTDA